MFKNLSHTQKPLTQFTEVQMVRQFFFASYDLENVELLEYNTYGGPYKKVEKWTIDIQSLGRSNTQRLVQTMLKSILDMDVTPSSDTFLHF